MMGYGRLAAWAAGMMATAGVSAAASKINTTSAPVEEKPRMSRQVRRQKERLARKGRST